MIQQIYVLENLEPIIQENAHLALTEFTFQRILQNPALSCQEVDLYKAVLAWHQHHNGDFQTHRETLLHLLSMLDLKLIDLNSMADCVHTSGVFSLDEMAELYKLRINLHQFGQSSRVERRVRSYDT